MPILVLSNPMLVEHKWSANVGIESSNVGQTKMVSQYWYKRIQCWSNKNGIPILVLSHPMLVKQKWYANIGIKDSNIGKPR